MHHHIDGKEFLVGKYSWRMMNTLVAAIPLLTTRKPCPTSTSPSTRVFPVVLGEGVGVEHTGGCWGFGLMSGSEAPGSWHCALSIFVIFAILRSMEWPVPDYHNSRVFMNETRQKFAQVPLLVKKMMWKRQRLTCIFNMRYGYFWNQLISW